MEQKMEGEERFDLGRLSGRFINNELIDRTFAIEIARLAVELAQAAGEEVRRPLSETQISRALQVNKEETRKVYRLLEMRWEQMHHQGKLGDAYRPPKAEAEAD